MQKNGKVRNRRAMRHGETNMRLWYKARIWQSKTLQICRWITQSPSSPKRMGHLTAIQSVLSKWHPSPLCWASKSHGLVKKFKITTVCFWIMYSWGLNGFWISKGFPITMSTELTYLVHWPRGANFKLNVTIKQFRFTYLPHKAVGGRWKK